ncbi:hypothetical protein OE88DRAFT_561300 [Heliocybe sulcata]|uniref:Uncharacterized protein n=1 Tax=Heliocybe sulcata TaxID=5364 RepID=A0A5C3MT98_9AGAM|nr:hypothetical protein OE88DRAFT_561300 [Heliocybe sulcata]
MTVSVKLIYIASAFDGGTSAICRDALNWYGGCRLHASTLAALRPSPEPIDLSQGTDAAMLKCAPSLRPTWTCTKSTHLIYPTDLFTLRGRKTNDRRQPTKNPRCSSQINFGLQSPSVKHSAAYHCPDVATINILLCPVTAESRSWPKARWAFYS